MPQEEVVKPEGETPQGEQPKPGTENNTPTGAEKPGESKPGAGKFVYEEDRSKWIPPHRLGEESGKRTAAEQERDKFKKELDLATNRMRVLAGLNPADPKTAEADELREAFKAIRPDLAKLDDEKIDRLLGLADRFESIEQSDQIRWEQHGRMMLDRVADAVSEAMGGELSERQRGNLNALYTLRAESDPAFLKRHLAGDPKLVEEFTAEFAKEWIDPARRRATSQAVGQQRRVPSGRGTAPVVGAKPKVDYKSDQAVEDAAVARFRELGGSFGG